MATAARSRPTDSQPRHWHELTCTQTRQNLPAGKARHEAWRIGRQMVILMVAAQSARWEGGGLGQPRVRYRC